MIKITIDTENENMPVVFSEIKDNTIVGQEMVFEKITEVSNVNLLDIFKYWREVCILNNAPFGHLLTGKQMLRENVYGREQRDFFLKLKQYVKETSDPTIVTVKTEVTQDVTDEKLKHYNQHGTCPDCHGKLIDGVRNGTRCLSCEVCNSSFITIVPTFWFKAQRVRRIA